MVTKILLRIHTPIFPRYDPTHDGGYMLTGSVFNHPSDLWLIKVDSMGCAVPRCDTISGRLSQ